MPQNLWNDDDAAQLPALDGLVYRSNLLGQDRAVVNIFGGNTSVKLMETDHLGREVEVLWVKGSGSDVATIKETGFAGLRQAEIMPLMSRDAMSDEEMVEYLSYCTHALGRPRQSIETLLHAFTPAKHVDHTHPDSVTSLACTTGGHDMCYELWGTRMVWVDYIRPGFTLSKWIGEGIRSNPHADLVVMGKHGLVTWAEDCKETYAKTIQRVQEAEDYIVNKRDGRTIFSGVDVPALSKAERQDVLATILPQIRGLISQRRPAILQTDDCAAILNFVGTKIAAEQSQIGAACPDHLVHVKRQPLFLDWSPAEGVAALSEKLPTAIATYVAHYEDYFQTCSSGRTRPHRGRGYEGDTMGDPYPRVILIPGVGMINTGAEVKLADVSRQLYHRAVAVIEGCLSLNDFISLTAQEAFDIEYWPLELYKLSLKPPPRELDGRVAVVTGAASGIGRATAHRLAQDGAHIAIFEINIDGAKAVAEELEAKYGASRAIALACDVTSEEAIAQAFRQVVLTYGGVDIVVSNAGIAISAAITDSTVSDWNKTMDIMGKGYFLVAREAFRLWQRQDMGGSLIFITSKNAVAAGKNTAIYSAVKAAEQQMARCLAEEGGAHNIRVNCIMPDAVLQGSGIWDAGWREARAANYGIKPEELDDFYRQRNVLKVKVLPENVAEAISFLAGPRTSRTTGAAITVDGGVSGAYFR